MQAVFLKVYHKGQMVTSRQFRADQISIGSIPDGPSLVLADPSVCSWHALIERRGGGYYISDLGSPTGTFVNSKQILESSLKHGCKISVGDFEIHFFIGVPFVKAGVGKKPVTASPVQPAPRPVPPVEPVQQAPPQPAPPVEPVQPVRPATPQQPMQPARPVRPAHPTPPQPVPPVEPVQQAPPQPAPPVEPVQQAPLQQPAPPVEPAHPAAPQQPVEQATPPHPPASSLLDDEEVPPIQEDTLTDVDMGSEFTISPLNKTFEEEDTDVSALKETEVIPPSALPENSKKPSAPKASNIDSPASPLEKAPAVSPLESVTPPPPEDKSSELEPPSDQAPSDQAPSDQALEPLEPADTHSHGTFAPRSAIQDLDTHIPAGGGPVVEVTVAWKERVLSVNHFFKEDNKTVTFGSHPSSDIYCPNLTNQLNYTLLQTGQKTAIFLSKGVKAGLIDHKGHKYSSDKLVEKGLISSYGSRQTMTLNQNQLVRLDFSSSLRVYVRYSNRSQKALSSGLFDFNFSEMMGLMMSFFFMSMLFFYLALFSPQLLSTKEELEEEGIKKATIEFKKKPLPRVVKLKMGEKTRKKKISLPHKAPKRRKKVGIKKPGKQGRLGQVAAKPKSKSKKKTITSARPGGSVTTGKSGAGPKSPRPDPTKIGLLGVFGKKGTQQQLDKAYSGTGELAGLAEQATGYAGQKESYTGKGIGTQFKNTGAGGKGSALIGVSSGIKTRGRGGGVSGYGRGGSLGSRGRVQLQLGTSDWEVEGGVDKNAILRVIRRNKHQLEWCYEFALQKKPDLEGKVLVQWNIVNERVRNTKVKRNTTYNSALARCLMSRLKNFRFTGTGLKKGQIGEVSIPFVVTKK